MNHGIVCWLTDAVSTRIWDGAVSRGEFIAIYTSRPVESSGIWHSAFVRSLGEPAVFDPRGLAQQPGFRHPTGEYARYEPEHDRQFVRMVDHCMHHAPGPTPILPAMVSDEEALRLLGELDSLRGPLHDRLYDHQPHDKRPKSERRLRDVLLPIRLRERWAFFLGIFHPTTPIAIFLSKDPSDVEALAEVVKEDWPHKLLIENW